MTCISSVICIYVKFTSKLIINSKKKKKKKNIYIYNTYSTSLSTIWENILWARKIFSWAEGEWKYGVRVKYHSHIVRRVW